MVHQVIGYPDLDPASSPIANENVKAKRIITEKSLTTPWAESPVSVFLNPPGGKIGNKSLSCLFWQRLVDYYESNLIKEAIYLGFSIEQLATTQSCTKSIGNFMFCVPKKRIKFVNTEGKFNSPTHANVIAYMHGTIDNRDHFSKVFSSLGLVL
jgi:hypothetical protein